MNIKDLTITLAKNRKKLVQNVSFKLEKGKVLGVIGDSGSGKSLTCKAIMQLLNNNIFNIEGSVKYQGEDMLKMSKKKVRSIIGKDISIIMQNPMTAFDPVMKIGKQLIETIRAHTNLSKKQAYDLSVSQLKAMNLTRVTEIMNSYPHALSGGMLQRIMIALSLVLKPKIIIADEATTALDVKTQSIILEQFLDISNKGIGLMVISHDFGVIAQIADDVIVMKDGKVIESGSVNQIFYHPSNPYTKELLKARLLTDEVNYA
ncbi:ABC transporter ATP-binding protein [Clostridiaceae bacterium M8S5]|nr:ABC transporter ATP-binding protein [Clostridiaceae bacterium M8S5]